MKVLLDSKSWQKQYMAPILLSFQKIKCNNQITLISLQKLKSMNENFINKRKNGCLQAQSVFISEIMSILPAFPQ